MRVFAQSPSFDTVMLVPYVLLGGAQLAVGAAAIFARFALTGAGPLAVSAARLTIAALVLLGIAFARGGMGRVAVARRDDALLAFAGVSLAIHFAAWIWSLEFTTVAVSTLLVATTPAWTAAFDAVFRRRPLSGMSAAAFAAGGVGLLLVVAGDRTAAPVPGHALLGAAMALTGSLGIAAYLLIVRDVRRRVDTTRPIVTRTYAWAAVALIAAAVAARQPLPPVTASAAWGGIAAMALISQLLGHTALNASLRWFSPNAVSFASLLEPVAAAALAFVAFREPVPPLAMAGAVILLASISIVLREERQLVTGEF